MKKFVLFFAMIFPTMLCAQEIQAGEEKIYETKEVTEEPQFPGGIRVFYDHVHHYFVPPKNLKSGTNKVFIEFVIEKDGTMSNFKIIGNNPNQELGKEAIRVLQLVHQYWTPAKVDSVPVRSVFKLPIIINIR